MIVLDEATTRTVVTADGPAMGGTTTVHVLGATPLAQVGLRRIGDLERRWSRFDPDSELSRLNAAAGAEVLVSPELFTLVAHAVAAWRHTRGRFDPTGLNAVAGLGYSRSFETLPPCAPTTDPHPCPGAGGIELDQRMGSIRLPHHVALDPGGIGKGLAADLVAAELIEAGAEGVLVDLDGDLRAAGSGPDDGSWWIEVRHGSSTIGKVGLEDAGIATSAVTSRRWSSDRGGRHHLVDPSTGDNPTSGVLAATAIAATAWWAEAVTKSVMVDPSALADLPATEVVWTTTSGHRHSTDGAGDWGVWYR